MVRETRHLWVGNLPDNIREDRIREHFKRYGRVQNVKLLGRTESASMGAVSGVCATVAFMDIKSASKAHNAEHVLEERTLTTEYYEPAAIPSSAGVPSAGSSPAGSGYSGSSSSVNSAPAPASVSRYHLSGGEEGAGGTCAIAATAAAPANWRGTNDSATEYCRRGNTPVAYQRYQRNNNAPYSTPPSNVERTTPHHRWYGSGSGSGSGERGATGGESTPSTPGGGTESGRRRRSGSGSSRSDSSSPEPSDASRASTPDAPASAPAPPSTPPAPAPNPAPAPAAARTPPAPAPAPPSAPPTTHHHQWASTASGRPLAICVRNLPTRSTDSSLKDGLYHEYKKHGKVVWVKVVGQNADRYAVVRFKKPSDVEKALEVSQDKLFFGCKISVAPHQSCDEDADSAKPYETDIDEYHPKATRTLFIGNLEKDVTQQQLRDKFKHYGRIIEIDIKKGSGGGAGYAFCQYASISSVVEAIRAMDGEYVGGSRVKLGFGKPVATTCVWVDGLTEHTEKQVLVAISRCGTATSVCVDRAAGAALVHFEQAAAAGAAVRELRRVAAHASSGAPDHDRPRLAVDYASRECQEAFYEQLEKHGGSAALTGSERLTGELTARYIPSARHDPLRYDVCTSRSRASSYGRGSSRTPRYNSLEHYDPADTYAADRRYRVYDELASSPQPEDVAYEDRLQSVVVSPHRSRRHRRDSSPEDRKHSKERHRTTGITVIRRSRSGSRGGERHAGRRRHRRRRDGSGSRAGTPLRDEPDAPPSEPRRPPRERPPLPMSLPLPKFAAQLLRSAAPAPRPAAAPAPVPDSPPRPPSASSSSAGSAPHSPSLEERIRSLDEKYEKWSGSRVVPEPPDRTRLRHRLLEVDINEVKPSEVVLSLLAKRSVFDEDSERLEGAVRAPSPGGSPRGRPPPCVPRALRYPFPAHPPQTPPPTPQTPLTPPAGHTALPSTSQSTDTDVDSVDRPADPRLNRPERPYQMEKLGKFNETDYKSDSRIRLRTPSIDKPPEPTERRQSPKNERELERDPRRESDKKRRDSLYGVRDSECKSFELEEKEIKEAIEKINPDFQSNDETGGSSIDKDQSDSSLNNADTKSVVTPESNDTSDHTQDSIGSLEQPKECSVRITTDIFLERMEKVHKIEHSVKSTIETVKCDDIKLESTKQYDICSSHSVNKSAHINFLPKNDGEKCKEILIQNHINKDNSDVDINVGAMNSVKYNKDISELTQELIKTQDKNGKDRFNQNIVEAFQNTKLEKENIQFDITAEKTSSDKKSTELDKTSEERIKSDRDKSKHTKDRIEKDRHDHDKDKKNNRCDKSEKHEREKKSKDDTSDRSHMDKTEKGKPEKDADKTHRDKTEEKISRHEHHRKDKAEKDKRKDSIDSDSIKIKKEDKHKHEKRKDSVDSKRENKKDSDIVKSRKSSRDESSRDLCRKDSTDSSNSRASHDSYKLKELDIKEEIKEELKQEHKPKAKCNYNNDLFFKPDNDKDFFLKSADNMKTESNTRIKTEIKEEKEQFDHCTKQKPDGVLDQNFKCKSEITEKQRHYSLDSPSTDCKRKERLNSSSSLPSNIGHKRRVSSHDSFDSITEEIKKCRNESKCPERRDSKDSRSSDKHKTTKFSKGHFAKIIESKTKDDKKNQVKPPDDGFPDTKETDKDLKKFAKKGQSETEEKNHIHSEGHPEGLQNDLHFLATLELRSSEENERQKALRNEMNEKKRIQQLQQIQVLQNMQQDALHQAELMAKLKDEKKQKSDEKKKEAAREKRMSTDRKSRDDKNENNKKKNRKQFQSTDSSDSDEPKKHSIFDIVDDEPMYISMYDKVKARSCKNMQKQEEEKRQEKIKAKFSQLKQSRAKREEKKRSSWDEDSDSEQDRRKSQKTSMDSSSDDEQIVLHSKKHEKTHISHDYDRSKSNDFFNMPITEEDSRNKLSRKNSRTRIISDTSDDDVSKRSISKSPSFLNEMKKEYSFDSLSGIKDDDIPLRDSNDKIKKNSLLNLFGKSDSDDSKLKSSLDSSDKNSFIKSHSNDFSSECESIASSRNISDIRRKHKKKQKKHKYSLSDEDKIESNNESIVPDHDTKHLDKIRRHSTKKDKHKDKIRDSIDVDDYREDKMKNKKDKRITNNCFDMIADCGPNNKKEGKMEDIFGPLSDESDRDVAPRNHKQDSIDYDSSFSASTEINATLNNEDNKINKEKDDNKRRKDKKRKEKRPFLKEDDNSLDVDAVSKAIEARLFADSYSEDEPRSKADQLLENSIKKQDLDTNFRDANFISQNMKVNDKHDKFRRDSKEKKKKKKKSREDRQSRKEQYHFNHDGIDKVDRLSDKDVILSPKLLDIPLPNDLQKSTLDDKHGETKSLLSELHSLPRLTDSPPTAHRVENIDIKDDSESSTGDLNMDIDFDEKKEIEVNDIPMPPPLDNVVQDISEVPLPKDPIPNKPDLSKSDLFMPTFGRDVGVSEDAVRSISNLENEAEKRPDRLDASVCKVEKKVDEKPRAVISQEETEDAVAALLGESFGGKDDSFTSCYEEVDTSTTHQIEIESTTTINENIPEEDAEEMRQAVQNLNACEMEMKPDTPVSDNDLLLIDTDTEEADETPQDALERLPVNIIATSQSINVAPEKPKTVLSNIVTPNQKSVVQSGKSDTKETPTKQVEQEIKLPIPKRDVQQITSTATPVITSWTLTNKMLDPYVLNVQPQSSIKDSNEVKSTQVTTNLVQIKGRPNSNINTLRPIITPNRVSAPYQVLDHMIRPQVPNMQPPTIKIPEPHILYQKPPGIVISPRMTGDPRLQSPKTSPQAEGMTSPRLTNMTILSSSPQNLNSVGIASPNAIQPRSLGQVTVVRMQQPPLSPIQAMHLPHGARTMVSPNRPNSVLLQTQGAPIHFNRLPVTPVLAPISKSMNINNIIQTNKGIGINTSPLMSQQKILTTDGRKNEGRITDNMNEHSKIILSSTSLQHSTNPTVMAQNRLISMQNALHAGNPTLHLTNKVLINNMNHMNDKREPQSQKSEHHTQIPYGSAPIIHVAGVNNSTPSIIQSNPKSVMCTVQDPNTISRSQVSNVIHTLNSQRLLTTAPMSNVIQIDANKGTPSVLSMATIRSPTVLTKVESSKSIAVTTNSLTSVVMTPLLLKSTNAEGNIRLNAKNISEHHDSSVISKTPNRFIHNEDKVDAKVESKVSPVIFDAPNKDIAMKPAQMEKSPDHIAKCETDFEELLKDKAVEIKVTNDPGKKLEVNVGTSASLNAGNTREKAPSVNELINIKSEEKISPTADMSTEHDSKPKQLQPEQNHDSKGDLNKTTHHIKDVTDTKKILENTTIKTDNISENNTDTKDPLSFNIGDKALVDDVKVEKITTKVDEKLLIPNHLDDNDSQIKNLDENDSWSAKDINIESVIKKVDSLCNDPDLDKDADYGKNSLSDVIGEQVSKTVENAASEVEFGNKIMDSQTENENIGELSLAEELSLERNSSAAKRGSRSVRGKRSEKNQDRVQTRQIGKPPRGGGAKRGRGRAKVDKKIKSIVNNSANNIPGDVYDFHEDSGDESSTSPNKAEPRPRLILTIKSPLSGHSNVIATSTLSITQKDQQKNLEKLNKEEKPESFISPSTNTRKSRRLQEKDVQRNTVDDVIDDVVKGPNAQSKNGKDLNKKRQTRQTGAKVNQTDKTPGSDTRKSPRGAKRTRDRSLSDASVDSSDEKTIKRDDKPTESKVPKITDTPVPPKVEPVQPQPAKPVPAAPASVPTVVSTPIMKPPKKMISEMTAKLASVFEAAAAAGPARALTSVERVPMDIEKPAPPPRAADYAPAPPATEPMSAATGDARGDVLAYTRPYLPRDGPDRAVISKTAAASVAEAQHSLGSEAALARRLDAGGMAPVGVEASDARVQSPALPHRPPSAHRLAERGTPLLVRGAGEGEGRYVGPASLPRGAHHPPLPAHHPHKQIAVVGPHHHHPGAASRVTITSVPSISPQGPMAMGEGYPHFSHQQYQIYQQHFRATQHDSRATPSPYTRSLEAEGSEAPAPPLELRRPPSARVPRPAHSPSPADRHIMYAAGCGRSPPPAHGTSRLPGALPPSAAPGPPHASQVPREADSLQMLLRRYPVMWQGLLALKNDSAAVQMHFVGGNPGVAADTLPRHTDGSTPPLRIAQRMRLEPAQLDQVHRKMKLENEHCILLALPCGRDHMDVLQQSTNLTGGFITYLQRKQAAGIVNVAPPGHHQAMYTVHIFPSCDFANENLNRIAPDLMHRVADIAHLLIVIATATV